MDIYFVIFYHHHEKKLSINAMSGLVFPCLLSKKVMPYKKLEGSPRCTDANTAATEFIVTLPSLSSNWQCSYSSAASFFLSYY